MADNINKVYNVVSNPVNEGALAGRYAKIDLSNTGKFTNILTALPVRHRFKVTDEIDTTVTGGEGTPDIIRTITLLEGSAVTLLNGHSDTNSFTTLYEYYTVDDNVTAFIMLESDVSLEVPVRLNRYNMPIYDPMKYRYVVYKLSTNSLELVTPNWGDEPYEGEMALPLIYKEDENMMYARTMIEDNQCSIPLGYFDGNWNFTSFSSIGFYDKMFWADQGIDLLIPDGRNDISGLRVDKQKTHGITFTHFDGKRGAHHENTINFETGAFLLKKDGSAIITDNYQTSNGMPADVDSGYVFVSEDNYIYGLTPAVGGGADKVKMKCCRLCDIDLVDGRFSLISGLNVYQAANFKDLKDDIMDVDERTVHLTGDEDIEGTKKFVDVVTFDNIDVQGGTITNLTVAGAEGTKGEEGYIPAGKLYVDGVIELTQDKADEDAIDRIANNKEAGASYAYDGERGGFHFKRDAYIVDAGDYEQTNNCFNVIGATDVREGGIVLGRYYTTADDFGTKSITQANRIYGDANGNITVTAKSVLPSEHRQQILGSPTREYANIYSQWFTGTATAALWADLAEKYRTDAEYPVGTIVEFGGEAEMTIAKKHANAVISEKPAYLMNAGDEGQPIALVGRVRIRVVDKVKKFDTIVLSDKAGVGKAMNPLLARLLGKKVIARALEDKVNSGEELVLCAIKFSL